MLSFGYLVVAGAAAIAAEGEGATFRISSDPSTVVLHSFLQSTYSSGHQEYTLYADGRLVEDIAAVAARGDQSHRHEVLLEYRVVEELVESVLSAGLVEFDWNDYPECIRRRKAADAPNYVLKIQLDEYQPAGTTEGQPLSKAIWSRNPGFILEHYPDLIEVRAMRDIRRRLSELVRGGEVSSASMEDER